MDPSRPTGQAPTTESLQAIHKEITNLMTNMKKRMPREQRELLQQELEQLKQQQLLMRDQQLELEQGLQEELLLLQRRHQQVEQKMEQLRQQGQPHSDISDNSIFRSLAGSAESGGSQSSISSFTNNTYDTNNINQQTLGVSSAEWVKKLSIPIPLDFCCDGGKEDGGCMSTEVEKAAKKREVVVEAHFKTQRKRRKASKANRKTEKNLLAGSSSLSRYYSSEYSQNDFTPSNKCDPVSSLCYTNKVFMYIFLFYWVGGEGGL